MTKPNLILATETKDVAPGFDPGGDISQFGFAYRLSTPIWVFDIDHGRILHANASAWALWGAASEEELCARDMNDGMSPTVAKRLRQYQSDFSQGDAVFNEMWTLYPNGEPVSIMVLFSGIVLPDGRMAMLCEVAGEAENQPQNVRSAEALLHTDVMIGLFSREGPPLYLNPAARNATTRPDQNLSELFHDSGDFTDLILQIEAAGEYRMVARVNTQLGMRWFDLTAKYCSDAVTGERAILVTAIDVSELKTARDTARYLADRDQLTGCYNRSFLQQHIHELRDTSSGSTCAILYFDVDRFKQINDNFGHETGDKVLKAIASRAMTATRHNDLIARLGGDEFVVVLNNVPIYGEIHAEIERIRLAISQPVMSDNTRLDVTISMGATRFQPEKAEFADIMREADLALYAAKSSGRDRTVLFDAEMGEAADVRDKLEVELKAAIRNRDFVLFYQPRFDLRQGKVVSVEALVRWQHPEQGLIYPDVFIPVCEETGMIDDLGQQVLEMGCQQAINWRVAGESHALSINISPRQFNDERLMQSLRRFAKDPLFPIDKVELEITENVLIGDPEEIAEKLKTITKMGYRVSIDDFGTGYSNLSYISQFPLHCIKVDRTFIDQLPDSGPIVHLILTLGQQIGAEVVAEGVETAEQMAWLRAHDCCQVQGYYLSRPVPMSDLSEVIARINDAHRPAP